MNQIAKRDDWKTLPMPSANSTIAIARQYSDREFERLSAGQIPEEIEDKWFVFYEKPDLFLHRSWTGACIIPSCVSPRWPILLCDIGDRQPRQISICRTK